MEGYLASLRTAEVNECQLKLAKFAGAFVWHAHDDADAACHVLLIEPRGVVNTGDAGAER